LVSQSYSQSVRQSILQSVSQTVSQTISQTVSQTVNPSVSQSVRQSVLQSVSYSVIQSLSQSVSQSGSLKPGAVQWPTTPFTFTFVSVNTTHWSEGTKHVIFCVIGRIFCYLWKNPINSALEPDMLKIWL